MNRLNQGFCWTATIYMMMVRFFVILINTCFSILDNPLTNSLRGHSWFYRIQLSIVTMDSFSELTSYVLIDFEIHLKLDLMVTNEIQPTDSWDISLWPWLPLHLDIKFMFITILRLVLMIGAWHLKLYWPWLGIDWFIVLCVVLCCVVCCVLLCVVVLFCTCTIGSIDQLLKRKYTTNLGSF